MEWISVETELPTKKHNNIVCLINAEPIVCFVINESFIVDTTYNVYFCVTSKKWFKDKYFGEVTHWMPLPDASKEY